VGNYEKRKAGVGPQLKTLENRGGAQSKIYVWGSGGNTFMLRGEVGMGREDAGDGGKVTKWGFTGRARLRGGEERGKRG